MPILESTIENWRAQIRALERGDRWCVSCGTVSIERAAAPYIVRCPGCYRDFMQTAGKGRTLNVCVGHGAMMPVMKEVKLPAAGNAAHCKACGSDLERDRIDYALRHSGGKRECMQCLGCSRGWNRPVHGLLLPTHWHAYLDLLFPSPAAA